MDGLDCTLDGWYSVWFCLAIKSYSARVQSNQQISSYSQAVPSMVNRLWAENAETRGSTGCKRDTVMLTACREPFVTVQYGQRPCCSTLGEGDSQTAGMEKPYPSVSLSTLACSIMDTSMPCHQVQNRIRSAAFIGCTHVVIANLIAWPRSPSRCTGGRTSLRCCPRLSVLKRVWRIRCNNGGKLGRERACIQ